MKRFLFALFLVWPAALFALTGKQIQVNVYEKLSVPINDVRYPDSMIYHEIAKATVDIQFFALCSRIDVKLAVTPYRYGWRIPVAADSGISVITMFRRTTTADSFSNLQGFAEITPDKFGQVQATQPVFANTHVGDTLVVKIQPTPKVADTLWAEVAVYAKTMIAQIDSTSQNPLPYPYEGWVATLAALRVLTYRDAAFKPATISQLYGEFREAIALHRKDLIERISDLYVLPPYIQQSDGAKPK